MGKCRCRWLIMAAASAGWLLLSSHAPIASAQESHCSMTNFVVLGIQACPSGTTTPPPGFPAAPQDVALTPREVVLPPSGQLPDSQGQEIISQDVPVGRVAQRPPRGEATTTSMPIAATLAGVVRSARLPGGAQGFLV
jgi:hypothetical protein